jgi:triosephosphate isomerase
MIKKQSPLKVAGMMKKLQNIFLSICLITLGLTFVFSGFVKAVDPVGGAIKFTDYFNALNLTFLNPISLPLSILLASIEFLIGIHLVMRIHVKVMSWLALIFMSFFTILTLYIAIANPVTDCGCFGDALKLTNWQTFFKNMVLLPMAIVVFINRSTLGSSLGLFRQWILTSLYTAFILIVSLFGIQHLPLFNFRPYKVGVNIAEAMTIPPGAPQPIYETRFICEKNGIKQEFDEHNYPYNDSTWVFVEQKSTLLQEGYKPPIHNFSLRNMEGGDVTDQVLNDEQPVFLFISSNLEKMDRSNLKTLTDIHILALEKGFKFYCLTSSLPEQIKKFDIGLRVGLDYLTMDETEIKTMIRANPGLILLSKGTIIETWHGNDIENARDFENPISGALKMTEEKENRIMLITCILFIITGTSIVYRNKK